MRRIPFSFPTQLSVSQQVNRAWPMWQVAGGVNLPSREQCSFTTVVVTVFLFLINIFLYLQQLSRPSQHRCADERGRRQQYGPLLYVVVPELSECQVGGTDLSPWHFYGPSHHSTEFRRRLSVTCKCPGFALTVEVW